MKENKTRTVKFKIVDILLLIFMIFPVCLIFYVLPTKPIFDSKLFFFLLITQTHKKF